MLSQLFKTKGVNPSIPQSLQQQVEPLAKIQELESDRFFTRLRGFNQRNPTAKIYIAGVGAVCLLVAFNAKWQKEKVVAEIERRKDALSQPVVNLSDSNGTTIPWTSQTVKSWLHRPVQVTGRQLHYKTMFIPTTYRGYEGFEYVVPLCTKETANGDPIEGVLLNKGFIPYDQKHTAHRFKIENSFKPETFTCYVSQMDEYQDHGIFKGGNEPVELERNRWNYADLEDMARTSGFQNQNSVKLAVLEHVDLDSIDDERHLMLRACSSDYALDYPYYKTKAGALQCHTMPWDYENTFNKFTAYGLASFLLSALLVVAK